MRRQFLSTVAAVILTGLFSGSSWSEEQEARQAAADNVSNPVVTVIGSRQADGVLGKEVRSRTGERLGRIVDVLVDRTGRIRAAVIDFGGFFGIGNRKIAVDWETLNFATDNDNRDVVTLELTREQIKAAPEYKDRQAIVVVGSASFPSSEP